MALTFRGQAHMQQLHAQ